MADFTGIFGANFAKKQRRKIPEKEIFRAGKKTRKFIQHSSEANYRTRKSISFTETLGRLHSFLFQVKFRTEKSNTINLINVYLFVLYSCMITADI